MAWEYWCAGVTGIDGMARFMQAMYGGMLILILPAFGVCAGIALMAYRRRDRFAGE
jgi:hypothetical protein